MNKQDIRIALAQINSVVGDLTGNARKISEHISRALGLGADIISFPELVLTGYPPEDLLLKPSFIKENLRQIEKIASATGNIAAIVGFVDLHEGRLYNAAAIIYAGRIRDIYRKVLLPNYGVFDEKRYFAPGKTEKVYKLGSVYFAVNICEDIWHEEGPLGLQAKKGAGLIININASPYHAGKVKQRQEMISRTARRNKVFISYTNLVGGQDELIFDGLSMMVDDAGKLLAMAKPFCEDLLITDIKITRPRSRPKGSLELTADLPAAKKNDLPVRKPVKMSPEEEIYRALVLGIKDYVCKNGFGKVVIGLSGGIDSSLVAVLAADALGKENVTCMFMPTRYSSRQSEDDSRCLAKALGIKFLVFSIEKLFQLYLEELQEVFAGKPQDITEENLQARIRGNILMALSNKFGWLVLTTGNKSEMSTGYATLYGDMAGGLAVIKDVPKTLVYKLAKYRNTVSSVIPESVILREPTAELRPDQKDSDSLPPYPVLDAILKEYVENDRSYSEIIKAGFDPLTVQKVLGLVDSSEYKRRQSPPGIKITPKAFGRDRRMPITNMYPKCLSRDNK